MNLRELLHNRFRELYFGKEASSPSLIRAGLIPFVPLYVLGRQAHQLYRRARAQALPVPVVSVGNLSLGGTGKTGFGLWLLNELGDRGIRAGVLKRGEGEEEGILTGNQPGETREIARRFGDEAALYRHRYPGVPLGVGVDRYRWGQELLARQSLDLILLDDGFQFTKLVRDRDLVLLDSPRELDAWQLPAGPLREPASALDRADWISVRGSTPERRGLEDRLGRDVVLSHQYRFKCVREGGQDRTHKYQNEAFQLVTTLARPGTLNEFLREQGLVPVRTVQRPDHDFLDPSILVEMLERHPVLMTQKEWVKLPVSLQGRVGVVISELDVRPPNRLLKPLMALVESDREEPDETPVEAADAAQ